MKIAIIGGTGMVGTAITQQAIKKNHQVTIINRDKLKAEEKFFDQVDYLESDAFALTKEDLEQFDVVIDAYAPDPSEDAENHQKLAEYLVDLLKNNQNTRIGFILGSSSLINKETNDYIAKTLEVTPDNRAEKWMPNAIAQFKEYLYLQGVTDVNWFGFSPQPVFTRGEATEYQIGTDQPIGQGILSTGNAAAAILDEIENPKFEQKRFTAANIDQTDWSKVNLDF